MKLSRGVSWFLLAFGAWSWFIWVSFVRNLWKDGSGLAFDDAGDPTAYFWVHLALAVTSFVLGTVVGAIGLRGVRALRRASRADAARDTTPEATGTTGGAR
ncbi:SCO4848 family membrane protein [Streptomyces sp. BI20]|uniref:SCO4848 family membrane protein n=1 Tax=Streptomyces sp. BI20 TaxID=3403460 RepID=UPI003C74AC05